MAQQDIGLQISEAALDLVGETGFDPVYGARPLKRSIQSLIENELAQQLLSGKFVAGDQITVDVVDGELVFSD